jgi:hypothetical protein
MVNSAQFRIFVAIFAFRTNIGSAQWRGAIRVGPLVRADTFERAVFFCAT